MSGALSRALVRKPRILVLNCYCDQHRETRGSPHFVPQAFIPLYLAGAFRRETCEVAVYCEFNGGPLHDFTRLAWADVVVLTGLNPSFDRMRHLTAYARTCNPAVVIIGGGSVARILPRLCQRYFDYVCTGDVEELAAVARDVLGPQHVADEVFPRFDLGYGLPFVGYAESTRNCNYRCSFCAMSAEDRPFQNYDRSFIRRQIEAQGYKRGLIFVDQNFYGGPRADFLARMDLVHALYDERRFGGWAAMVTTDFFKDDTNIPRAVDSGCIGLFSGIESFDADQIKAFNKRQNLILPQELVIRRCLDAGLVFQYGLVFDPSERTTEEFQDELEAIVANPWITLPAFLTLAIPILGTPLFRQRIEAGAMLPNVLLREMSGRRLLYRPRQPLAVVADYVRRMESGPIAMRRLLWHAARFYRRYRGTLSRLGLASALLNVVSTGLPYLGTNSRERRVPRTQRSSFIAGQQAPGQLYRPQIAVAEGLLGHFEPLYITDAQGRLHPDLWEDLGTAESGPTADRYPVRQSG